MSDLANEDLKGTEFQRITKDRCAEYAEMGIAHIGEYGVQGTFFNDKWQPIQSLPDFEGVAASGMQFIFDCKVCSQSSFALAPYRDNTTPKGKRFRQLKHMRTRARFSVPCFFLLHWNARVLVKSSLPPETYIFPIYDNEFWDEFDQAKVQSITRDDCDRFGVKVEWNLIGRARTYRPDFFKPVQARIELGYWES